LKDIYVAIITTGIAASKSDEVFITADENENINEVMSPRSLFTQASAPFSYSNIYC
jgi:hypothetical protein